ncbi:Ankyrin repeat domain-containing protein 55 [Bagarius yarrelli]|uniref:Ankyrin repeat domain-containing protein 55 n=1 Tax=Bagarius yarrelli TaxID=175774 RepID=A0A556V2M1_BAGYA|nr:Ankyrin repeat domain-containing protein 55 [Bagarius yarrelli]
MQAIATLVNTQTKQQTGWLEGCVCLLRNGAKQNIPDKNGRLPLHAATAEVDLRTAIEGMTALHWASFHNRPEHVQALLQKGADPTLVDKDFKTALHWAVQSGSRFMCSLILDHHLGSTVINYDDENGKTCVHIAAAAGYSDIIYELARVPETNLQALDVDERTPLHWAAAAGKEECVQALLQLGVEPGPRDINENTPLTYAMYCGHTACIKLLSADSRPDSTRQLLSQSSDPTIRKEGKFRVLNQIFSCKKKKELHAMRERELSQERHLQETSEVDDIITMFDCTVDLPAKEDSRKQSTEPGKHDDLIPKDHRSLPPIRTQSLPPITLGNSLLTNLHNVPHRTVSGQMVSPLAHRSQKSKSEHDLFDSRAKAQKATGPSWKTESSHLLKHKAWVSPPSDRILDKLLHETPSPIDVLCSNHTPYIQRNDQVANTHLVPLRMRDSALARNSLAPIRDHCTHRSDIMKHKSLRLFGLVFFLPFGCAFGFFNSCAKITPDSSTLIPVELGANFTAVCTLRDDSVYNANDVTWFIGNVTLPRQSYTNRNKTSSVTLIVRSDMNNPLKCTASKQDLSYEDPCMYGIYLNKGYPPLKPENLTCIALQDGNNISPELTCSWDPGTRDPIIKTNYTLFIKVLNNIHNVTSYKYPTRNLTIKLPTFPNHMQLEVWVKAVNDLGAVESKKLLHDSEYFAKPNPPANVRIIPEDNFPTTLIVNWTHPIHETIFRLKYHIRYCQAGCSVWQELPENSTKENIKSFRLQYLQPYTDYVVQVRCIQHELLGYWSEWSRNATARTPEAAPGTRPDLWRVYEDGSNNTVVKLIWKEPQKSNGKILGYDLTVDEDGHPESHVVTSNEYNLSLKGEKTLIRITANNSVGVSPAATLMIARPGLKLFPGVEQVNCSAHGQQLWVNWLPTADIRAYEYVIEWVSVPNKEIGWKRVIGTATNVSFKDLKPFKRYNVSVSPIYRVRRSSFYRPGTPFTVQAYLQQAPPLKGPFVTATATGKTSAQLRWNEIPVDDQQGFLINYTIFYKTGNNEKFVVVPSNTYSYKLTQLASDSHYVVHILVSNEEGSKKGFDSSFHTKKYDDGEIDLIVVGVCLGFLFFVLFIMYIFFRKNELIKRHLWPQVPDPSHSTIANWSPDCPNKPDTPKESIMTEVSVVEVDMDDKKSLCDEDKAVMPLKKYFSEERSSGIGGSSGMSTPRQSVSSNDEADSGQTTASTVQYSAVVSSGYKGQTPGTQAVMFSRSESTQPLLECEENPEHLSEASSHQKNSYFKRHRGLEQLNMDEEDEPSFGLLSFSPMDEEDSPTLTEDPPGPTPSYMPQQSGYRPQ